MSVSLVKSENERPRAVLESLHGLCVTIRVFSTGFNMAVGHGLVIRYSPTNIGIEIAMVSPGELTFNFLQLQ